MAVSELMLRATLWNYKPMDRDYVTFLRCALNSGLHVTLESCNFFTGRMER
jgi:hypothetical protein